MGSSDDLLELGRGEAIGDGLSFEVVDSCLVDDSDSGECTNMRRRLLIKWAVSFCKI
jgi:hypothetical protein